MKPRRVLHVAQSSEYGLGRYLSKLIELQVADGWEVSVAGDPDSLLRSRATADGAQWYDWRAVRDPSPASARELRSLHRVVAATSPDIVHLHSSKAGLIGRLAIRGRLPTIFQPHGWSFFAMSGAKRSAAIGWERLAGRWTDVVLCVSEAEQSAGQAEGITATSCVVPTAIDIGDSVPVDRADARRTLGLGGEPLAVCAARLATWQKGQDVLLRAWLQVEATLPDARLVLLGDGPDRELLEQLASPTVKLMGIRDDVSTWFAAANVIVQPSRYEGLSISVLEAVAAGRSVVATDAVGMREILGDRGGAIVPVDADQELAAALVARLKDTVTADAEGAFARNRAATEFSSDGWRTRMRDLYLSVASRAS